MAEPMKILFIGNKDSIWTKAFIENVLLKAGATVSIPHNPLQSTRFDDFYHENNVAFVAPYTLSRFVMKIPKLRVLYRLHKEQKAFKRLRGKYDKIIIMYTTPHALKCAKAAKGDNTEIYTYFIGSDILRSSKANTQKLKRLIAANRPITVCESCQTTSAFQKKIGHEISHKINTIYLGNEPFLYIDKWLRAGRELCKNKFGIPTHKISVCIGYNASPAQQHDKVIEQIAKLDNNVKEKIFLVLPIAYGGSEEYVKKLENDLEKTGVGYCLSRQFLNADEVAAMRVATDVFINAQTTDSISASVMEAYYAKASLISASWLNYEEFSKWDLDYVSFDTFDEINTQIIRCLHDRKKGKNRETVFKEWSWETCKNKWISLLKEKKDD